MSDLPEGLEAHLLGRWNEPHRRYHAEPHLRGGLEALALLGAGRAERIAFWFHDAVHTCTSPSDEEASAALAIELLDGVVGHAEVDEIARLVMVTYRHDPDSDDRAGCRVSDADLAPLALPWECYAANAELVRSELVGIDDAAWRAMRLAFLDELEGRAEIFHTPLGSASWEADARGNLARERLSLTTQPESGRSDA